MLELLLLTAALSTDNFAVSIGYGSSNTKISSGMTVLLNVFCSAALVASAQFGKSFLQFAEPEWGTRVCAGCFFLMGSLQMLRELKKHRRKKQGRKEQGRKKQERKEEFPGTWEKQISALEFGVVSGIFILDLPVTGGQIFFTSFAVGMTAMYAGYAIGKRTGRKKGGSGAVMGGLLFYLLAVLKLKGQN